MNSAHPFRPTRKDVTDRHYRNLAENYDDYLLYSDDFVRTLTRKMIDLLALEGDDVLVDLGCGTGMYSIDILKQVPLKNPIIGVDAYSEMLAQIPPEVPIDPVNEDAVNFSRFPLTYDKILMKETVHHVEDRRTLFSNLLARLPREGRMLLVHVPPEVDYPLFEAALERCREWHANPDELERELQEVGFSTHREPLRYSHRIEKSKYFEMVRGRYMSVLTSFEPEEIEKGLEEMEARHANAEHLEFIDHFDCILGTPRAGA